MLVDGHARPCALGCSVSKSKRWERRAGRDDAQGKHALLYIGEEGGRGDGGVQSIHAYDRESNHAETVFHRNRAKSKETRMSTEADTLSHMTQTLR